MYLVPRSPNSPGEWYFYNPLQGDHTACSGSIRAERCKQNSRCHDYNFGIFQEKAFPSGPPAGRAGHLHYQAEHLTVGRVN